jgi:predicted TPR repeat methyltransferase
MTSTTWAEAENMQDLHKEVLNGNIAAYDNWAPLYDANMIDIGYTGPAQLATRFAKNLEENSSRLTGQDSISVLDIGCGTGLTVDAILKNSKSPSCYIFTGVDIHNGMLKLAEAKGIYKDLQAIDLNNECLDGKWDVIVSTGTFVEGHVKLEVIFELLEKNLSENGMLMVTTRSTFWDQSVTARLEALGWECTHETIEGYMGAGVSAEFMLVKRK